MVSIMTRRSDRPGFTDRPADPEQWIKAPDPAARSANAQIYCARLTIDVTVAQRAEIKIAAVRRGLSVTDMLRDLLAREFPPSPGDRT